MSLEVYFSGRPGAAQGERTSREWGGAMAAAGKASLGLHAALREARQRNGLKHADYGRYRQYSTRRLRRLRKALKFSNVRPSLPSRPPLSEGSAEDLVGVG